MCAGACACVCACVHARVCLPVCVYALRTASMDKILGFTNILIITYPLFLNTHGYVIKKKASHQQLSSTALHG